MQRQPDCRQRSILRSVPVGATLVAMLLLVACGGTPQAEAPADADTQEEAAADTDTMAGEGTLAFRANGEDFVRQGFVTKDGWAVSFDNVYVTLADVTAYQTASPFDAEAGGEPQADVTVSLDQSYTVDLAEGDENAETVLIDETTAPAGRYNALSWEMVEAADGPASGTVIMMVGTAEKDGETVGFTIRLDKATSPVCGDFVGDERKGVLEPGGNADLEATFHFDHIFGDAETPADDSLNQEALGFEPFAALATDGVLDVTMADLEQQLSAEDYEKLMESHLEHVGEGACVV